MTTNGTRRDAPTLGDLANLPAMLRPAEAFELLAIGPTLGWKLLHEGRIPSLRLGRAVRIPTARLRAELLGVPE